MLKSIVDYFFKDDQSAKEKAAKIATAAVTILTVALTIAQQIADAFK